MDTAYSNKSTLTLCSPVPGLSLKFKPLEITDIEAVRPSLMANALRPRTCDFTVGGLFMWIDYFKYNIAIAEDDGTLFVAGLNEADLTKEAFLMPSGGGDMRRAVGRLLDYCQARKCECVISAVPESALSMLGESACVKWVEPIDQWNDYLYNIQDLATLSGKKYGKKRNHVNQFMAANAGWRFEPVDASDINDVKAFFDGQQLAPGKSLMADYERLQVKEVLNHTDYYGFEGALLRDGNGRVVAFTFGEAIDDTLFVHIEKMDHRVDGSGETINKLFAAMMAERHAGLRYVNREDDAGDPGLRQAKLSYHPCAILQKYNVCLTPRE